ncbi:MAG: 50S ribosomal protein L4 [bacterium]
MKNAKVILASGEIKGEKELGKEIFGISFKKEFMNEAVKEYQRRDTTSSTLTKGEVRGGGRKPYRQKGTGLSRAGSIRSPLRRGGGITFGPAPRKISNSLTKKKKRLALKQALSFLSEEGRIYFAENLDFQKTKQAAVWLAKNFGKTDRVLIVDEKLDKNFILPLRNIQGVDFSRPADLNIKKVLYCDGIIFVGNTLEGLRS